MNQIIKSEKFMFLRIATTLLAVLFLLNSCDVSDDGSSNTPTGTLQVYLTDAPGNYEAVWIDIEEVRIHVNEEDGIDEDDEGWITISDEPMRVNLLELTNGELEALGETELEEGMYSQIRLILGDDNEIVKNGVTHSLDTPSAQQSGLKLNVNAEIEGGQVYTLLLDFDASRSVVEAGNSGKFLLKPVIRTVAFAKTGAIEGDIQPAESLPWVYAIAGIDTVAGTRANAEGEFRLIGLLSGSYQVAIDSPDEGYSDEDINNVNVTAPDTTDLGLITLEEDVE